MSDLSKHPYPKNLFHPTLPAVFVYTPADEQAARDKGYGDTYVPQPYPKVVGYTPAGNPIIVNSAEEEAARTAPASE